MAVRSKKKAHKDDVNPFINPAKEIQQNSLERELETSFLPYAVSVIIDRAIPSTLDGLIPVQRRILYSMYEDGYTPDKNHVKSAKIVGAVIGNYHPHGDSACYGAMVRLTQDFTFNVPLVDGHGAFGEEPGSEAAAPRYTEARLSMGAMSMVDELKEDVVDFVPNYDNSRRQPVALPVKFPNLLINGATGIAVGFATNMPTHNPGEVIDATRWLLKHPNADLEKLMTFIPGPDFPSGGMIVGQDAIKQAYETGRGSIKIRATSNIKSIGRGKNTITFTEMPYGVNAEKIIEKVKEQINIGNLQGISDIRDLTDQFVDLSLVVETKAGVNPDALLIELYKRTELEKGFGINNIALVDETPRLLGLKEQLEIFIAHRIDVVTRRTQHRKEKRDSRLHILLGMIKAIDNIDEVIAIVRKAESPKAAQEKLMKRFVIDEIQADYILAINLGRLTKFEKMQLEDEQTKLKGEVVELNKILDDDNVLRELINKELIEVRKQIDRPRRSVIVGGSLAEHMAEAKKAAKTLSVEVADEPCFISLSARGGIIRSAKAPRNALATVTTTTRGRFILVTNKGRGFRIDALHVGEKAAAVSSVLPESLSKGEKVISLVPVTFEGSTVAGLAMGTKNGIVKVLAPNNWPKTLDEFDVIALAEGDEIIGIRWMEDNVGTIFSFVSEDSSLLAFKGESVRPQGSLTGAGVAGIKLSEGMKAIEFAVLMPDELENALVVTHTGDTGKVSKFSLFGIKGRAGAGMRSQRMTKLDRNDALSFASIGVNYVLKDASGQEIALPDVDPRRDGAGKAFELPVK